MARSRPWRLIPPLVADGLQHMAIDTWLLEQYRRSQLPPILRFYTWSTPTLSLGYHQQHWPEHWRHLVWQGQPVALVRRPSGGRAVLHGGDELTYALVTDEFQGSRRAVYETVCQFLIQGFRALEMPLMLGQAGRSDRRQPNCFSTATAADLVLVETGLKLVGSAQLWRQGTLLQHGSMLLRPESALFERVFQEPVRSPPLPAALANLDRPRLHQQVIQALVQAASSCFGAEFQVAPLTMAEIAQAQAAYRESPVSPGPPGSPAGG